MAKRTTKLSVPTVESIIAAKIAELESQDCMCVTTIPTEDEEAITITCDRCREIEALRNHCTCGVCRECLELLLSHYQSLPCECTYRDEEITVTNPESGLEEIHTIKVIDVMCRRCNTINSIEQTLSDYDLMAAAYIDEADFDKYVVVDGVIKSKVIEPGVQSDMDALKEDVSIGQFMQDMAIDTMMFEVIPDIESRIPATISDDNNTIKLMKGMVREMGAYFADRIIRGVVTYKDCFSVSYYKKYQAETDAILRMEGYGHLIVPIV